MSASSNAIHKMPRPSPPHYPIPYPTTAMTPPHPMPARMFNLEGTFLGFIGSDPKKPKSIILEAEQEQMAIKLPKELRAYARSSLKVGDRLRCIGSSQVDFKARFIKLQAYQVFFLPPADPSATTSVPATASRPEAAIAPQPLNHAPPSEPSLSQKRAKILVCRKSGCQKRGGRQMAAVLEHILQTYQLQNQVEIRYVGCQKRCSKAPNLTIMPGKHYYEKIDAKDLTALIAEHFCSPPSPH